jgi:hypothetical protein
MTSLNIAKPREPLSRFQAKLEATALSAQSWHKMPHPDAARHFLILDMARQN